MVAANLASEAVAATFGDDVGGNPAETEPIDNEEGDDDDGATGDQPLSRGQRKRMKRRTAFMKKMGLVNRVVQEKAKETKKQQHGAFADLEELQKSLFVANSAATAVATTTGDAAKTGPKKNMSGKQRQKLAVRELGHLKAVHTHPSFQGDPFAAIQMHLKNTVVQANQDTLEKAEDATSSKKPTAPRKRGGSNNKMDVE